MDSDSDRTSPSISCSLDSDPHECSIMSSPCGDFSAKLIKTEEEMAAPTCIKFSIENILRPDFGCKVIKQERYSPRPDAQSLRHNRTQQQMRRISTTPEDWPAWVFCTRYSDRPSSGPRIRRSKRRERKSEEKRPRTAFTQDQLDRLKTEFQQNRYLTEKRRQDLAKELQLNESQIKIWFQNKRAKLKKTTGPRHHPLQLSLMAQGLYHHNAFQLPESD